MHRNSSSFGLLALVFLLALGCSSPHASAAADLRRVYDFNPGWRLLVGDPSGAQAPSFDDSRWKPVTLPRAWNEDDAFRKDIADLSTGIAWYRKSFTLPQDAAGKKVFLEFEGARQAAEVYVNGTPVGRHENGINAFGFDVSDLVRGGDNVVAVRTDNGWDYRESGTGQRFQWSDKNFNANYGGLPKNVRLHVTDRLYQTLPLYTHLKTTGVYVYAKDFDLAAGAATVAAESQIKNEYPEPKTFSYEVEVLDLDGKLIAAFSAPVTTLDAGAITMVRASARVSPLNFWSWGYGYLYDVITRVLVDGKPVDVVRTRTGFRSTAFGDGMFKLNGRVLQVHGYAQRTSNEWPAVGMSVPPWLSDFSNRLMVESNGNLVRWMHITPWRQDVESCDRVGLLQAMPAGDSEADVQGRRWEQRLEVMRDSIIYNRNSPSIIFYEAGNRGVSEEHMREMKALRDEYDPHGGRAAGSREMLGRNTVAEYGGEMLYINKSARIPFWAMEYSRDEALRKYWDEFSPPYHKNGDGPLHKGQDASAYNRNQDTQAVENVLRWFDYWCARPGTGRRVSSGGVNIVFSDTNTHHRGAENYRRSGEVDAMRIPKDGYYAHQVMWDGWVDVERARIHIVGHWNYAPGTTKSVHVISSAQRIELFLNGKSLGAGEQSARFLFTYPDVAWQPGTLLAVGYDAKGVKLCEQRLETAGPAAALRLSAQTSPAGLRADGADLALLQVEVMDAQGRRCPTALDPVEFTVEGPAEWRGGIAQGPDNYILSSTLPVECGVNRVLVRSTTTAGRILVKARSGTLRAAQVELNSEPVQVVGGLGLQPAAEGLPGYLERGPTPATPSFRPSRNAMHVAHVSAGSAAADASKSFDDDETTAWTSERGAGAWIAYQLAEAATPTEVCLKLSGWRQRSYPLRITLDGQIVFEGTTPKSLGYVTLPLKPATGRQLKVELTGSAQEKDEFKLVEVANQKITDTGSQRVGAGVLAIVELEIYGQAGDKPKD